MTPRDPLKCPQCGVVYDGNPATSHRMDCGIRARASMRAYAFGHIGRSDAYAVAVRAYAEAVEAFTDRSSA